MVGASCEVLGWLRCCQDRRKPELSLEIASLLQHTLRGLLGQRPSLGFENWGGDVEQHGLNREENSYLTGLMVPTTWRDWGGNRGLRVRVSMRCERSARAI